MLPHAAADESIVHVAVARREPADNSVCRRLVLYFLHKQVALTEQRYRCAAHVQIPYYSVSRQQLTVLAPVCAACNSNTLVQI